ncbi:hypothetical protein BJX63DRAFT_39702 [Aspergillus granulosus]|uniref:ABC transmembrane type-1 domain-containing protein n=1 Tax=Aspergillus granulosus TaxID=176169 RepID=A0ABR4GYI7_9EURO
MPVIIIVMVIPVIIAVIPVIIMVIIIVDSVIVIVVIQVVGDAIVIPVVVVVVVPVIIMIIMVIIVVDSIVVIVIIHVVSDAVVIPVVVVVVVVPVIIVIIAWRGRGGRDRNNGNRDSGLPNASSGGGADYGRTGAIIPVIIPVIVVVIVVSMVIMVIVPAVIIIVANAEDATGSAGLAAEKTTHSSGLGDTRVRGNEAQASDGEDPERGEMHLQASVLIVKKFGVLERPVC